MSKKTTLEKMIKVRNRAAAMMLLCWGMSFGMYQNKIASLSPSPKKLTPQEQYEEDYMRILGTTRGRDTTKSNPLNN